LTLGGSIDVARRNLPVEVLTVQADAERLPFAPSSFDLVMSIGVLHHLEDPQRALNHLVQYVRPGGHLHVYLYWTPEIGWHRPILQLVALARRATIRLPYRVLHRFSYPLAAGLWFAIVLPYRFLRSRPAMAAIADTFPLKTYADYPFGVLVNDQFDRFSAPIEHRFSRAQVNVMLERAGLEDVLTIPNHGWLGHGTRPTERPASRSREFSVVVTVRNDREDLRELLPGLANQTVKPDEILIIDGGSVDGTLEALEGFALPGTPINVTVAPGANIAAGRNIGIRLARNELIACTDAGCRPAPNWLEALGTALEGADLASGVFVADGRTELERLVSLTHYPVPEELDQPGTLVRASHRLFGRQYLASRAGGRSMAFRRDVWQAVGGFPRDSVRRGGPGVCARNRRQWLQGDACAGCRRPLASSEDLAGKRKDVLPLLSRRRALEGAVTAPDPPAGLEQRTDRLCTWRMANASTHSGWLRSLRRPTGEARSADRSASCFLVAHTGGGRGQGPLSDRRSGTRHPGRNTWCASAESATTTWLVRGGCLG
jgi:hypothetical protein